MTTSSPTNQPTAHPTRLPTASPGTPCYGQTDTTYSTVSLVFSCVSIFCVFLHLLAMRCGWPKGYANKRFWGLIFIGATALVGFFIGIVEAGHSPCMLTVNNGYGSYIAAFSVGIVALLLFFLVLAINNLKWVWDMCPWKWGGKTEKT